MYALHFHMTRIGYIPLLKIKIFELNANNISYNAGFLYKILLAKEPIYLYNMLRYRPEYHSTTTTHAETLNWKVSMQF